MTSYHCSIEACGFETDSPLGMVAHSRAHRNRYRDLTGREPESYEEVRRLLNDQPTLHESALGSEQASLREATRDD